MLIKEVKGASVMDHSGCSNIGKQIYLALRKNTIDQRLANPTRNHVGDINPGVCLDAPVGEVWVKNSEGEG